MKTLEERAKEYAKGRRYEIVAYVAYIAGAIGQKDIDIDKACEWLEGYCCEIGCKYDCNFDDIMVDGPKRFRKAMEEQI